MSTLSHMKTLILISLLILTQVGIAQSSALIGKWTLIKYQIKSEFERNTKDRNEIEKEGIIWTIELNEDGSLIQTTNIGKEALDTNYGVWRLKENELEFELKVAKRTFIFQYHYFIKSNTLELIMQRKNEKFKLTSKFEKLH